MQQTNQEETTGDYRERYVAFLDLLGFKNLVECAESEAAERDRLGEVLRVMRDTLCHNSRLGLQFTHFSDCIVISLDRTADGLAEAIHSIVLLTSNLLQFDVLVRGALVAGPAHHTEDFVFGTAVNRAYVMESTCTVNPMTQVSSEVLQDAEQYGVQWLSCFAKDDEGRCFIDYLREFAAYRPEPIYEGKWIMDEPAKRIVDFMCHRLNTCKREAKAALRTRG
jgi:class 3 adenylate cyclase